MRTSGRASRATGTSVRPRRGNAARHPRTSAGGTRIPRARRPSAVIGAADGSAARATGTGGTRPARQAESPVAAAMSSTAPQGTPVMSAAWPGRSCQTVAASPIRPGIRAPSSAIAVVPRATPSSAKARCCTRKPRVTWPGVKPTALRTAMSLSWPRTRAPIAPAAASAAASSAPRPKTANIWPRSRSSPPASARACCHLVTWATRSAPRTVTARWTMKSASSGSSRRRPTLCPVSPWAIPSRAAESTQPMPGPPPGW